MSTSADEISDHYLIYTVFFKSFVRKERAHKEIKFRNYRKFSPEEFRKELLENDSITNTDWPEHMLSEKWDKFKNVFLTVSNKCEPFETRRLKSRNNPCRGGSREGSKGSGPPPFFYNTNP